MIVCSTTTEVVDHRLRHHHSHQQAAFQIRPRHLTHHTEAPPVVVTAAVTAKVDLLEAALGDQ